MAGYRRESDDDVDDDEIFVTKRSLKQAITLLNQKTTTKQVEFGGKKSVRECHFPALKAHNLCYAAEIFSSDDNLSREILEELRASLLENNYPAAIKLLQWLVKRGTKSMLPIIWKTATVLFLNHQSSDLENVEEFLEMCADKRLQEEKIKLIEALLSLPDPDLLESRTRKMSRHKASEASESRSITETEDDPDYL